MCFKRIFKEKLSLNFLNLHHNCLLRKTSNKEKLHYLHFKLFKFPQVKGDSVPLEGDGMNLDILEEKVKKLSDVKVSARHPFRAAVYVIPVYHNPTGICYSAGQYFCQYVLVIRTI